MRRRILFVEDEAAFAVGMRDRLESEGYEVEWAQAGQAGYEMALARPFDLIAPMITSRRIASRWN